MSSKISNVICVNKSNGERFVFTFDAVSLDELRREVCRMANDPELCFSWADAARVAQKAGRLVNSK